MAQQNHSPSNPITLYLSIVWNLYFVLRLCEREKEGLTILDGTWTLMDYHIFMYGTKFIWLFSCCMFFGLIYVEMHIF